MISDIETYTAFAGVERVATADLKTLLQETKRRLDGGEARTILIFEDATGVQVDFDLSGTVDEVLARLATHPHLAPAAQPEPPARPGPGRPKLGVVSREVSLLPRHWEWLEAQPAGCSAALRRLVEEARRASADGQDGRTARDARTAMDAAGKFLWTMAGDLPGFEEVTRDLWAGRHEALAARMATWPPDIAAHALRLLGR